jgi:chromosome partitioning protein
LREKIVAFDGWHGIIVWIVTGAVTLFFVEHRSGGMDGNGGKIVAVINQKGGVGKTTTTVNLGAVLARELGQRVLLVDLDPQGSMSDHVGLDPNMTEESIYDVIVEGMDPAAVVRTVHGMDAIPANLDLASAEFDLAASPDRNTRLRDALAQVRERYDFILLDCPPSLGLLTVIGLAAADEVVVAMEAEYLALRGISQLMQTVEKVSVALNPALCVSGVLFCRFDGRVTLAKQVRDEVEKYFPGKVFATTIRRNVRLAEAPSMGLTILDYDPKSAGAEDYRLVAREFMARYSSDILAGVEDGEPAVVEAEVEADILASIRTGE